LAAALARLLRDDALCTRMGEASRGLAVESFDEERILDQYVAVYEAAGVLR
jgi:glycosyltransferase involved in cell wall biosynthesis